MNPSVQLNGFTVRYRNFVLEAFDLDFAPGERVAFVGANGAGKSTTLKAIAGRATDYAGQVSVDGTDIRSLLPAVRANIGFLPERPFGFGWMTVAEHLRFLSSFFPAWDGRYAHALLRRLEVPSNSKVGTLSGGMAAKLSLTAAEAFRPPLLILDEPTSAVDPVMRGDLLELIDECAPAGGDRLVLFSTHILEDVERIADRVVLLRGGQLIADMSAAEIRRRHPTRPLSRILHEMLRSTTESMSDG